MKGKEKILRSVFQEHFKDLCRFSYSYVLDVDEAKDIVQEVFLTLLEKNDISHVKDIDAYVRQSVYHESLKSRKRKGKLRSLTDEIETVAAQEKTGEHEIIAREEAYMLVNEISKLPEGYRKAFELCVVHGLKYSEAAEGLGVSVNTIKTQVKKAYKILRQSLVHIPLLLFAVPGLFF
ncbi:RNA polymerase sigma factor [Sinomicrobium soli]|uniref:RNA polymerase sigma factor n=1 Tax=Sinomicrobium sp. N-1-3-6 TaxID=2219864 RepID=UPI00137514F4|nr:sigma-70 family RNA polymerase sigma factor [Sinomicrobium sp. N-1-3-6]